MKVRRSRQTLAMLLALLVAIATPPGVGRAAEGVPPDLEIKYLGRNPNNSGEILFRVTNVGKWWVDATEATVETTVGPNPDLTVRIPDLGPKGDKETASVFEFAYPGICSQGGWKVKATLKAARDWAGDVEKNLENNIDEEWVCQPYQGRPAPAPAPAAVPEHLRVGRHTIDIPPSFSRMEIDEHRRGEPELLRPLPLAVGWAQLEGDDIFGLEATTQVVQTAAAFDLAMFDEIPFDRLVIYEASVTFHEHAIRWTNHEGQPAHKSGCVARIGISTTDWVAHHQANTLFPYRGLAEDPAGRTRWAVTDHVKAQVENRAAGTRYVGYVLSGFEEHPLGTDDTSCLSGIQDIKLHVRYQVLIER